jgi:hypothetical protein
MSEEYHSVDEFEPKGYRLHNVWEWYSNWIRSSLHLRKAARATAECARMATVSFPNPQRHPISRDNLRGRSPP